MDFIGTGRRLAQGDLGDAARALGIETAVLLAFLEVEAAGRGFDSKSRPKMLFEPHVLYRNTKPPLRDMLVQLGLAYRKWGAKPYPADSYPRLSQAIFHAKDAAWLAGSYGLPQILGENYADAGFPSPAMLFAAMTQGEREQLMAMVTLLKTWGLAAALIGKDFTRATSWEAAAKRYNGKGFAKHNYHGRLAAAYLKHSKNVDAATGQPLPPKALVPAGATVLEEGMKGEAVRSLQADLQALGYTFAQGIDGRFGGETYANVRLFQADAGIVVDGKAGSETLHRIAKALLGRQVDQSPPDPPHPGPQQHWLTTFLAAIAAFFMRMRKE